jgi:hypothetical protein
MAKYASPIIAVICVMTAGPASALAQPKQLRSPLSMHKRIEDAPIWSVLEYLAERREVKIRIDESAFKKIGAGDVRATEINVPRMEDVPLEFVLEACAQQVGGTVRVVGNEIVIAPGKRKLESTLGPPTAELKKKLAAKVKIEKPIDNAPWTDVVEFFSEKCDVCIIVAEWQFPLADRMAPKAPDPPLNQPRNKMRRDPIPFQHVTFSAATGDHALEKWLDQIADRIQGKVIVRDKVILIVPASNEKS